MMLRGLNGRVDVLRAGGVVQSAPLVDVKSDDGPVPIVIEHNVVGVPAFGATSTSYFVGANVEHAAWFTAPIVVRVDYGLGDGASNELFLPLMWVGGRATVVADWVRVTVVNPTPQFPAGTPPPLPVTARACIAHSMRRTRSRGITVNVGQGASSKFAIPRYADTMHVTSHKIVGSPFDWVRVQQFNINDTAANTPVDLEPGDTVSFGITPSAVTAQFSAAGVDINGGARYSVSWEY